MSPPPKYSTLFSCLHDEPGPVGRLGRGTHYSICRSVEWLDATLKPLAKPERHDFAVVWDEDHDTRVVDRIESLLMDGLLSPVQFIGERKGQLTVVLAERFHSEAAHGIEAYLDRVQVSINSVADGDYWPVEIDRMDTPTTLVSGESGQVSTYIRNIDNLWCLKTLSR